MTNLLKKDSFFFWSEEATQSFERLKLAMTQAPILQFLDFDKEFTVETDACNSGIGVVLQQEAHPIAFYCSKISGRQCVASIYIKEMFSITQEVAKWRHYLVGRHFTIKTDHKSLKNLPTQVIQIPYTAKKFMQIVGL